MSTTVPPSPTGSSTELVRRIYGGSPFRMDGDLLALAFTPDGQCWSLEEPGLIRLWSLEEEKQLEWHPLDDPATCWAFSPEASYLAGGSMELNVWETASGDVRSTWLQRSWVTATAFSPDAQLLAVGHENGVVRLWEWSTQRLLFELVGHPMPVSALAFRQDGKVLASAGEDKTIRLWDLGSGTMSGSLLGHTDRISDLAWHPDGVRLVSTGWDTTARVWDTNTCKPIILLNSHAGQVHTLTFSQDGKLLACADSDHAVHLWDMARHRPLEILRDKAYGEIRCLAFHPSRPLLVFGGEEGIIHQWDVQRRTETGSESGAGQIPQMSLALAPEGNRLYSLTATGSAASWETESGNEVQVLEESVPLTAIALAPNGLLLAGGLKSAPEAPPITDEKPDTLMLWNAQGKRLDARWEQRGPIWTMAFSMDSGVLAAASHRSGDVWLWRIGKPEDPVEIALEPLLLLNGIIEGCAVECLAWHPRDQVLAIGAIDHMATSGSDGQTALWDVREQRCTLQIPGGVQCLAWHPDGQRLAAARLAGGIRIWDVAVSQQVTELRGHLDLVTCLSYSTDGKWLASTSEDHTIRLWDSSSGKEVGVAEMDTLVKTLVFSKDGRFLYTGNANASCYQLEVSQLLS